MHLVSSISVAEAWWPVKILLCFPKHSTFIIYLLACAAMKIEALGSSPVLLLIYLIAWYYIPEACNLDVAVYFATLGLC